MRLRARLIINGAAVVGAETWSWDNVGDGNYMLRFPPMGIDSARDVAYALSNPAGWVALEVSITEIPTVLEIDRRLSALEQSSALTPAQALRLIAESQRGAHEPTARQAAADQAEVDRLTDPRQ